MNESRLAKLIPALAPAVLLTLLALSTLAFVRTITEDSVRDNRQRYALRDVVAAMPLDYDNDLYRSTVGFDGSQGLDDMPVTVHVARNGYTVVGVVVLAWVSSGYNGPIQLATGISEAGVIIDVRVRQHRETPGLGARIEPEQSDWLAGFRGASLNKPMNFKLRRDGGIVDALSGATVTSSAVMHGLRDALAFYAANKEEIQR